MPSNVAVSRLSSVSSQDSGFTSQEQFFARPPSPLEEAEREVDGSASPLLVVCSTLNAWAKRPEIPSNCKHPATVTGAPEPVKSCRPAITAHTFDPPSPSLFEKPNWQINEEINHHHHQQQPRTITISEDGPYGTISRQHSVPSRRCRIRDLSLERHSPMREQHYQSTGNNINGTRPKPAQPPTVPQEYYGTITNRLSPDDNNQQRLRSATLPSEAIAADVRTIVWRDRQRQNGHVPQSQYGSYYDGGQMQPSSFESSADETLDEMYEYLSKSIHPTKTTDSLRRGMSIALGQNAKPAPPIRRTPSMNTTTTNQNGYIELQSRLKARLKRAEELADQVELTHHHQPPSQHQKMTTVTKLTTTTTVVTKQQQQSLSNGGEEEFPPPPPDFFFSTENDPPKPTLPTARSKVPVATPLSLLAEIQRGVQLRKTAISRDKSAPRLK